MRFLLDTNILIPLEDSKVVLQPSLSHFILLANQHGHELLYHPASERDISRDRDVTRQQQTLARITSLYHRLSNPPAYPNNTPQTDDNDAVDNEILYALKKNVAHALITEDRGIHVKAKAWGIADKVYYIQPADDWLTRLHSARPVSLPNIREISLYELDVNHTFFDSLRAGYIGFNNWFEEKCREGRKTWIYGTDNANPEALCIYAIQDNEPITDDRQILSGRSLKLCTFKVGESVRGRKIGELFLKTAFRYATENHLENIFLTAMPEEVNLIDLLTDYGFVEKGSYGNDLVYVKPHPVLAPVDTSLDTFDYHRHYFPHYREDANVRKFIVPIKPQFHEILFPDSPRAGQLRLINPDVGNAIKLAYLSHAQTLQIQRGDIVMFYRSDDSKMITSLGIVESFLTSSDAEQIAGLVSRRTVYNLDEITSMARKSTKVMMFRLVKHFLTPLTHDWLKSNGVVNGSIQSIRKISDEGYRKISQVI